MKFCIIAVIALLLCCLAFGADEDRRMAGRLVDLPALPGPLRGTDLYLAGAALAHLSSLIVDLFSANQRSVALFLLLLQSLAVCNGQIRPGRFLLAPLLFLASELFVQSAAFSLRLLIGSMIYSMLVEYAERGKRARRLEGGRQHGGSIVAVGAAVISAVWGTSFMGNMMLLLLLSMTWLSNFGH